MARMKYGLVETSAMPLSSHGFLGGGHRVDEGLAREQPFAAIEEGRRLLVQLPLTRVKPPREACGRHVEDREYLAQHVLLLHEDRRDLDAVLADVEARLRLRVLGAGLERLHGVGELLREAEEEEPGARAH